MGKLTKSRVLQGGAGLRGNPRGRDGAKKISHNVGGGRDRVRQNHAGRG